MRLVKLKIENFASYKKEEIDFEQLGHFIACHGITGAGKTTLLVDAITFALFGVAYGEKNVARHVIAPNATSCRVELIFEIDGKKYRIVRKASRVGNRAETKAFLFGPDDLNREYAQGVRKVNEEIRKLIGLEHDAFLQTIAVRQGDVASLVLSPRRSQKLKALLRIFNLDFSKIQTKLKKELDKIKKEYNMLRGKKLGLIWRRVDQNKIKAKIDDCLKEKETLLSRKNEIKKEIDKYTNKLEDLLERKAALEQKIDEVTRSKEKTEKIMRILNEIKNYIPYDNIRKLHAFKDLIKKLFDLTTIAQTMKIQGDDYLKIQERIKKLEMELSKITKRIKNKEKIEKSYMDTYAKFKFVQASYEFLSRENINKCPLCGSELSEIKLKELLSKFEKQQKALQEYLNELRIEREEIRKLELKEAEIKKLIEVLKKEESKKREQLIKFRNILKEIEEIRKTIGIKEDTSLQDLRKISLLIIHHAAELENLVQHLSEKSSFESATKALENELKKTNEQIMQIKKKINILQAELGSINSEVGKLEERIRNLQKELEDAIKIEEELRKIEERMSKLEKEKEIYEVLVNKIFDEKGLPSYLLGYYLEAIETIANRFLSRILPRIKIKIVKVLSKEGEDVDIEIYDGSYKRPFFTFSGGEQAIIGFALRIALANVLSQMRFGRKIGFLIIDEGFGPISEDLRRILLDTLRLFSKEIGQVFVISHVPDVKEYEAFDSYVIVEKEGQYSKIRIEKRH